MGHYTVHTWGGECDHYVRKVQWSTPVLFDCQKLKEDRNAKELQKEIQFKTKRNTTWRTKKKYNRRQREIQHRLLLRVESAVIGGAAQPLCLIVQIDARSLVSALYTTFDSLCIVHYISLHYSVHYISLCIVQPNFLYKWGG